MSQLKLAENMRELRAFHGYTQEYVSQRIHIARQTYSSYENGNSMPDLRAVCELSELYRISIDALLYADFSESIIAESSDSRHTALLSEHSSIGLSGADARMIMNYKEFPPNAQKDVRDFVLFKKKQLRGEL